MILLVGVKDPIDYGSLNSGLFCPRFLASCSLYLQAEQSNDILKLKESHLQRPPYFATVANINQAGENTVSIDLTETQSLNQKDRLAAVSHQNRERHIDAKLTKTPGYWPGALNVFAKVIDQTGRLPPRRNDSSHQQGQ